MAREAVKKINIEYSHKITNGKLEISFYKSISTDNRPNKASHVLKITLSEIIFQDYENISTVMFGVYKEKIDELINQFNFDVGPMHKFDEQSVTHWIIKVDGSTATVA